MGEIIFIVVVIAITWIIIKIFFSNKTGDGYNRDASERYSKNTGNTSGKGKIKNTPATSSSGRSPQQPSRPGIISRLFTPSLPYDKKALSWCTTFLGINKDDLANILADIPAQYTQYTLRKRSGGYRIISAPNRALLSIQQTIYYRILLPANIHPAATGFRKGLSITDNANPHLGNKNILKTDIHDFFGSIRAHKVKNMFESIGYPPTIAVILKKLTCLKGHLPQGAPTSPAISNIIVYEMDKKLVALSDEYQLVYSRYADDLTFSGNSIPTKFLPAITLIVSNEGLDLNTKKTRFITEKKRKIITGISISSGSKLTIPKAKKREMRKNIHFILTKGLHEHQKHIGSTDPAYLKRILGYLSFWQSVEPENNYVSDSIEALKKISR